MRVNTCSRCGAAILGGRCLNCDPKPEKYHDTTGEADGYGGRSLRTIPMFSCVEGQAGDIPSSGAATSRCQRWVDRGYGRNRLSRPRGFIMHRNSIRLAGLLLIVGLAASCEAPQLAGERPTGEASGPAETMPETSEPARQTEAEPPTPVGPINFDLTLINEHRSLAGQHPVEWDEEVARTAQLLADEHTKSELGRETLHATVGQHLGRRWSMRSWSAHSTASSEQMHEDITGDHQKADGWLGEFDLIGIGAHHDQDDTRLVYLLVQSFEAHRATVVAALPDDPVGHTLELINATRAEQGAAPLAREPYADQVAQRWTEQMAASGALEHNPGFHAELADGISDLASSSENVGFHSEGLDAAHQGLVNSPGHYANIIGDHDAVGLGVAVDERGIVWVTHNYLSLDP